MDHWPSIPSLRRESFLIAIFVDSLGAREKDLSIGRSSKYPLIFFSSANWKMKIVGFVTWPMPPGAARDTFWELVGVDLTGSGDCVVISL